MAFRDFGFPDVLQTLGLTLTVADLFGAVPAVEVSAEFEERVRSGAQLAQETSTEKAKSEFVIAPVLFEVRRRLGERFGLHSGVTFDIDSARGLNGVCDFLLTRSPIQLIVTAPVVAVAESKNDDTRDGFGQCIAAMVASRDFNADATRPIAAIHGVAMTGLLWQFLRLVDAEVTFDDAEYSLTELGKALGILSHILTAA